ncbi:ribosome biogenesis GTPase YlqF [Bacillota bacterium LX-D]|nr:ribosome biogenesis GTPase YlqF [Bacillota bacterium LX-D]
MQVQWYPGHMAKAKRMLKEQLKLVDIVIEVLDARIPISSGNPDLNTLIRGKPRLIVLNKSDLADSAENKKWIKYFADSGFKTVAVNSSLREGMDQLTKAASQLAEVKMQQITAKGLRPRPVRAMVIGVPNVGKSSLINALVRKTSTKTANKPGVTKGKQWVRVLPNLELLDTPGLLWPKFDSLQVGFNLAVTGAISDQVYDLVEAAMELLEFLKNYAAKNLMEKYKLKDLNLPNYDLLEEIGRKRGLLRAGGVVEIEKTALMLLQEFRQGKLGKLTLEKVAAE